MSYWIFTGLATLAGLVLSILLLLLIAACANELIDRWKAWRARKFWR